MNVERVSDGFYHISGKRLYSTFAENTNLVNIIINGSFCEIPSFCFSCPNLENVSIFGNVLSIGLYCFSCCSKLSSVTFPKDLLQLGQGAFCNCSLLSEIEIPQNVTEISPLLFSGMTNLESIEIHNNIKKISDYSFFNTSLKRVNIPDSVYDIGSSVFSCCMNLEEITFPENITILSRRVLFKCVKLKSFTIPSQVRRLEEECLFSCSSITHLYSGSNVSYIGEYAISECSSLTKLEINAQINSHFITLPLDYPDLLELIIVMKNITIMSRISNINLPKISHIFIKTDSIIAYGRLFYSMNLTSIIIISTYLHCTYDTLIYHTTVDNVTIKSKYCNFGSHIAKDSAIAEFSIDSDVVICNCRSFYGCTNIDNLNINSIEIYQIEEFDLFGFGYDRELTNVSSVRIISNLISFESSLFSHPNLSLYIESNISKFNYLSFSNLKSLHIPEKYQIIGGDELLIPIDCITNVKKNIISPDIIENLVEFNSTHMIFINNTIFLKDQNINKIDKREFQNCKKLSRVIISESITGIGRDAFSNCYSLKYVEIKSVDVIIEDDCFVNCPNLTQIVTPEIHDKLYPYQFYKSDFAEYILSPNVVSLGQFSFSYSNLSKIYLNENIRSIPAGSFLWVRFSQRIEFY